MSSFWCRSTGADLSKRYYLPWIQSMVQYPRYGTFWISKIPRSTYPPLLYSYLSVCNTYLLLPTVAMHCSALQLQCIALRCIELFWSWVGWLLFGRWAVHWVLSCQIHSWLVYWSVGWVGCRVLWLWSGWCQELLWVHQVLWLFAVVRLIVGWSVVERSVFGWFYNCIIGDCCKFIVLAQAILNTWQSLLLTLVVCPDVSVCLVYSDRLYLEVVVCGSLSC